MNTTTFRRARGFTLVEIMIVVLVVAILSWLAVAAIARIRDRAARSILQNNLRQLYQAKEFYFTETGDVGPISSNKLLTTGYLSKAQFNRIFTAGSLEAKAGWHYFQWPLRPGEPTMAYRGIKPAPSAPATDDILYYPAPPSAPTRAQPPSQDPDVQPSASTPQFPNSPGIAPPDNTPPSNTPAVGKPDGNAPGNQGQPPRGAIPPNQPPVQPPAQNHGPGNSDFGHSHNQGKGKG